VLTKGILVIIIDIQETKKLEVNKKSIYH